MPNANLARLLAERASEAGWYDQPAYYAPHVVTHGQIHNSGARLGKFCDTAAFPEKTASCCASRIRRN